MYYTLVTLNASVVTPWRRWISAETCNNNQRDCVVVYVRFAYVDFV